VSSVIVIAYAVGAILGFLSARHGALAKVWPKLIRAQLLLATIALSVVAVWRLDSYEQFLWPLIMIVGFAAILGVSLVMRRGPGQGGPAAMRAWAATPNISFWVTPVAAALMGSPGVVIAVLVDRLGAPLWAVFIWLLRRDAPTRQRTATSWIDQSPILALGVGLVLRATVPAPEWTSVVPQVGAPLLATSGAALYVGSVMHRSQRIDPRPGLRTWALLVALRVAIFALVAWFAPSTPIALVAVLCGLSIPAFGPAQFSTVYGYREAVVSASNRYGWYVGAAGLGFAVWLSRVA
jgi:predicted permease